MLIVRGFCVLITIFLFNLPAWAAIHAVGEVYYFSGDTSLIHDGKKIKIQHGDVVYVSDVIVTGHSGRVKLDMHDGSHIYIGHDSRINIRRYEVENGKLFSGVFNMLWGKARYVVAKLRLNHSEFMVVTKAATIGVRGTQFTVMVPKPSLNTNKIYIPVRKLPVLPTKVMLFEGVVVARTIKNMTLTMKPGQFVKFMSSGHTITRPIRKQDMKSLKDISKITPSPDVGTSSTGIVHAGKVNTEVVVLTKPIVAPIVITQLVIEPTVFVKPAIVPSVFIKPIVVPHVLIQPRVMPSVAIKPAIVPPVFIKPRIAPTLAIKPAIVRPKVVIKPVLVKPAV